VGDANEDGVSSTPSRGKSILIADDDPVVVMALSRRLQQLGYQVFRSPDAAHALLGAMKTRPDLLILDVNMPSGNGLAVCEMMASDPRYADIPVIIHSVMADDETRDRSRRLGAYYVEKSPRSWREIKKLVESLLGDDEAAGQSGDSAMDEEPLPMQPPTTKAPKEPPIAATVTPAERADMPAPACGRPRVLCIEYPQGRLELVDHQLSALGLEILRTADAEEGYWSCFSEKPHAIVIQIANKPKLLQEVLQRLSQNPVTRDIPSLIIDEDGKGVESPHGLNLTLLRHPLDWEELLGELERHMPTFGLNERGPAFEPKAETKIVATDNPDGKKPLTILCIDDDPVVARSIANRLQPYGIVVKSATSGTQGFLAAALEKPDIILLDMRMPEGEGNYVLSKLKENQQTADIPVLVLTIVSHAGVRRQMLAAGAAAFLSKPVRWPELFKEMSRCVELPAQLLDDYKINPSSALVAT
jgi:CheY-like chemotaxis protein